MTREEQRVLFHAAWTAARLSDAPNNPWSVICEVCEVDPKDQVDPSPQGDEYVARWRIAELVWRLNTRLLSHDDIGLLAFVSRHGLQHLLEDVQLRPLPKGLGG
jgi:hypothetical protein